SATAKTNAVIHTALAAAFGVVRQKRLGSVELHVSVGHTSNAVEVQFKISSYALVDALLEGSKLFARLTDLDRITSPEAIENIVEEVTTASKRIKEGLKNKSAREIAAGGAGIIDQAVGGVTGIQNPIARAGNAIGDEIRDALGKPRLNLGGVIPGVGGAN